MSEKLDGRPPYPAERILIHLYADGGKHTHLGDFEEVFQTILDEKGRRSAVLWYWAQVIRSLPGFFLNKMYWSLSMFRNYLTIAVRSLLKNRWFSLINLLGLAAGLACVIMILSFIKFELSFESFHEKSDRIFRVLTAENDDSVRRGGDFDLNTPELLAGYMTDNIPEVVRASRVMIPWTDKAIIQNGIKNFYEKSLYVDNAFLQMFSYPLIRGNAKAALEAPHSIVLTETAARRLFGSEDPVGKNLVYKERSFQYDVAVTGIAADPPRNSHLQFDCLLSVQTLVVDETKAFMIGNWNVANFMTYAELKDADSLNAAEEKLNAGLAAMAASEGKNPVDMRLQSLRDIHLRSQIAGQLETNNLIRSVYLFGTIAFLILLIAGINHMNMATARSATRAREVGLRKVVGASRRQLFTQFVGESLMVVFLALVMAAAIVKLALPRFSNLLGVELSVNYARNIPLTLAVLGIAILLGVLAGIYPALFLSSFHPRRTLKNLTDSGSRRTRLRNALVVFQFAASIILIACTLTVSAQLKYIRNHKLGFDREHVVVVRAREQGTREKAAVIKQALLQRPEVAGVSVSGGLPINIRSRLLGAKFEKEGGGTERMTLRFDYVDEDFIPVFGITMAQGRNFSPDIETDKEGVLVNESLVRKLGWSRPLGKSVDFFDGDKKVLGVFKDFYHSTFHNAIEPIGLFFRPGDNISIRIRPGDIPATLGMIRGIFERQSPSQPFDYYFLDDAFDALYRKEQRTAGIFGLFAGLAVVIACLGLLSLAAFSVERRTREIGVRKVLGASVSHLARHLTREYIWLVLGSTLIAAPVIIYTMSRWLANFAYRIRLDPWTIILSAAAALFIALVTVGSQTIRAALKNPADTLRCE